MKKNFIRLLTVLVSVIFLVNALAGCTGGANSGTPQDDVAPQNESASGEQAPDITLELWTWKVAFLPGFESAAAAYKAKTGVTVISNAYTDDPAYQAKVKAAANAGNLPDLVAWWGGSGGMGFENVAVNLKDAFTDEIKSKFYPVCIEVNTVKQAQVDAFASNPDSTDVQKSLKVGDIFGVPVDVGYVGVILCNNKMLEEAGVAPGTAPANWDEFVEMVKTVHDVTGKGIMISGGIPDLWWAWAGQPLLTSDVGPENMAKLIRRELKFSDPMFASAAKCWNDMVPLITPGANTLTIDDGDQAFASGQAAFVLAGTFTLSTLVAMGMDTSIVSAINLPLVSGGEYKTFNQNVFNLSQIAVASTSPHIEEAIDFAFFLGADPAGVVPYCNDALELPACVLSQAEAALLSPALQAMVSVVSSEDNAVTKLTKLLDGYPSGAEWTQFSKDIWEVYTGTATMEEVMERFDANAEVEKAAGR